jgi:2-haloacid dehalogenase
VTGYRAPSTGQTVRAVFFDTFGTVVDWRSGISSAVRAFAADRALTLDPDEFADAWRAQYRPSMERVRSGERPYVSLDTLHTENLDIVLRSHGIEPGAFAPGELTSLAAAWRYLPPWPDSVEGIRQIKRDFIVGPLSNGNTALLACDDWDLIAASITDLARQLIDDPPRA